MTHKAQIYYLKIYRKKKCQPVTCVVCREIQGTLASSFLALWKFHLHFCFSILHSSDISCWRVRQLKSKGADFRTRLLRPTFRLLSSLGTPPELLCAYIMPSVATAPIAARLLLFLATLHLHLCCTKTGISGTSRPGWNSSCPATQNQKLWPHTKLPNSSPF